MIKRSFFLYLSLNILSFFFSFMIKYFLNFDLKKKSFINVSFKQSSEDAFRPSEVYYHIMAILYINQHFTKFSNYFVQNIFYL